MSVGIFGLTFIVFLILKLAEVGQVADWSWWAVFAPLIIGAVWTAFWAIVLAIVGD